MNFFDPKDIERAMLDQSYIDAIVNGEQSPKIPHTKAYVCGFMFRDHLSENQVALIRKKRPEWQAGFLNGIGGKIEPHEAPIDAMRREFHEEAGVFVNSWRCFAMLRHNEGLVYMFTTDEHHVLLSQTDEFIEWHRVTEIVWTDKVIPNLHWLIPLSMSVNMEVAVVADDTPFEVVAS